MLTKMKKNGFTIIEVVIVIAIIALITGILTPIIFKYLDEANETATLEEMTNIRDAIIGKKGVGGYYNDVREFPPMYVTDGKYVYSGLIVLNRITTAFGELMPCKANGQTFSYGGPIMPVSGNSVTGWRGPYMMDSGSSADLLKDSWDYDYVYIFEPYEYDTFKLTPDIIASAQMPPEYVFLASKGPDGIHTRVEVKDNRMDGMFKLENYPENMDDIVMEIYTSPKVGGLSLLKKQDWPQ
jgi:prepilin-type N-terminal cleavage/methylation domain-containing protein